MNPSLQLCRFDQIGSAAATREYDAQLGAFAAHVAAIVDALAVAGRRVASLLSRRQTSVARASQ